MLNDTAEYALRAVLYLARRPDGSPVPATKIADDLGLPRNYLSKILRRLARRGILESSRGPSGGFSLARPADELQCLLGRRRCSDDEPCVAHHRWKRVVDDFRGFFLETTVGDLIRQHGVPASDPPVPEDAPSVGDRRPRDANQRKEGP